MPSISKTQPCDKELVQLLQCRQYDSSIASRSRRGVRGAMHLSLFVCLSVCASNSKTIVPIDLIFYTRSIIPTRCKYFDPCYARTTVVRARFLAAAFSDGSYLAHVNGAYLRHVTFYIVRGPPLFIVSPISQRGPASVRGPLPTNSARLVQSPRRRLWRGWTNARAVEYNLRPLF